MKTGVNVPLDPFTDTERAILRRRLDTIQRLERELDQERAVVNDLMLVALHARGLSEEDYQLSSLDLTLLPVTKEDAVGP